MNPIILICRFFFWLNGWKVDERDLPNDLNRAVVIAIPHTSNWDFIYCMAAFYHLKIPIRFTIKKDWMKPPFGGMIGAMGGLAIDRSPKKEGEKRRSVVQAMIDLFAENEGDLAMIVTPEGSRSRREEWKSGFYYVAKGANVPICLGYLNYEEKTAGVLAAIYPTDDMNADMKEIVTLYAKNAKPKHTEKFSLDKRWL